jgi:coproporphyrinogen III oxidase-like Fe-S oxidoreductase
LEFSEKLTEQQCHLEQIMLGLRLAEGFSSDLVGPSDKLADLIENGFLISTNNWLKPTPKGLLAADALAKILA